MVDENDIETRPPQDETVLRPIPKPPDAIQDLPEDQREELFEYFREVIHVEQTTGLMPPPSMLAAYSPEVQKTIVDEFAQHGQHRRTSEAKVIDASVHRERRGMWLGFILAFTLLICGTAIVLSGYSAEGLSVIAADAIILAVIYVVDRRSRESLSRTIIAALLCAAATLAESQLTFAICVFCRQKSIQGLTLVRGEGSVPS